METEEHELFECNKYGQERERWRGTIKRHVCYEVIKWYYVASREGNNEVFESVVEQ